MLLLLFYSSFINKSCKSSYISWEADTDRVIFNLSQRLFHTFIHTSPNDDVLYYLINSSREIHLLKNSQSRNNVHLSFYRWTMDMLSYCHTQRRLYDLERFMV
jgi:hypothetical protein